MPRFSKHSRPATCLVLATTAFLLLSACGDSGPHEPPPYPPSIHVSPSSIEAGGTGEDISLKVANGGGGSLRWSASIPADVSWARIVSGASGMDTGTIQIRVDANSGAARSFSLTITAPDAVRRTVTVRQREAPAVINLTVENTDLDGEGGRVTLRVRNTGYGGMAWTASLPEDADWARIESGETGENDGEVIVRYTLNGGANRELSVSVAAVRASNSPQSVSLRQPWFAAGACTFAEARQEIVDVMQETYYFNDEREQQAKYDGLRIEDFNTVDNLLDELRWMPETRDRGFTFWLTDEQTEMLTQGQAYVFGFRLVRTLDDNNNLKRLEVADVFAGSPAGKAGFERGDRIVALNGKATAGMSLSELNEELGPNEEGYEATFQLEKRSGEGATHVLAKSFVDTPTVPEDHVRVYDTAVGKAGYLHLRNFLGNAPERLLEEFADFKSEGVQHLIVDLRYNGGGLLYTAHGLATLIGGPELFESHRETVLARQVHNELLADFGFDQTAYFGCDVFGAPGLITKCENESALRELENVVFITGNASASASELVIVALQPYESVKLVGSRTYGKPVGQYACQICEDQSDPSGTIGISRFNCDPSGIGKMYLWPVSFALINAEGFEDYYDGLPVECAAPDDLTHPFGNAGEARIAAALTLIETGNCESSAGESGRWATVGSEAPGQLAANPIHQLIGF